MDLTKGMEGTLEKRVQRVFGHSWAQRQVRLTVTHLEVDGAQGPKRYPLETSHLIELVNV